jgi:hypothetical protein
VAERKWVFDAAIGFFTIPPEVQEQARLKDSTTKIDEAAFLRSLSSVVAAHK